MSVVQAPAEIEAAQRHFKVALRGMEAVEELNALKRFPVQFQSGKEPALHLTLEGGQSESFCVWKTQSQSGFSTIPFEESDMITIRFVTSGSIHRCNRVADYVGRPDVGLFVDFVDMVQQKASIRFEATSGAISRSALLRAYRSLVGANRSELPQLLPVVDIAADAMKAFRHNFMAVCDRLRVGVPKSDSMFPMLEEIVIYQLLTAWPHRAPEAICGSRDISALQTKMAVDYIEAHLAGPLKLADIAGYIGVSVRSLQMKFKSKLGRTPLQYIYDRRLDGVHADLQSAEFQSVAVSLVALRFGFTHPGDFSRRYRERYGCTPTQTQRSAAKAPARPKRNGHETVRAN